MCDDFYYNTKTIPLVTRETFNNTIILLTMVKSQYYYIVGFSRPNNAIEIAFDYESDLHAGISESMTVDFESDKDYVLFRSVLSNLPASDMDISVQFAGDGMFSIDNDRVVYQYKVRKEKIIPTSIEQMNQFILKVKSEIIAFLEAHYEKHLT